MAILIRHIGRTSAVADLGEITADMTVFFANKCRLDSIGTQAGFCRIS